MANVFTNLQDWLSGGLNSQGTNLLTQAGSGIEGVQEPDLTALIPQLQKRVQQGTMTPAQMEAAIQQATALSSVKSDQGTLQGAETGINQLKDIASNGGATQADKAAITSSINATDADRAQKTAAIIQGLNAEGLGGSGAALAAKIAGVQSGANANAATGATIAQQEQQRALDAMKAGVTGNTTLNQQEFDQAAAVAKAQDAVNAANAQARQAAAATNATLQQGANTTNFNTAQDVNKANTDITNQQLQMPLTTAQQQFTNSLGKQTNAAGAQIGAAKALLGQGGVNATGASAAGTALVNGLLGTGGTTGTSAIGGLVNGLKGTGGTGTTGSTVGAASNLAGDGGGAGGVGGGLDNASTGASTADDSTWLDSWLSDETLKTDKKQMSDDEADQMLAKLTGYKYRYKGDSTPQAGVMAQDMEKTPFKDAVVDTPAGKMINGNATQGRVLALMANNNKRIRALEGK